ncbi:hypothetical protein LCGC14_1341840 [marine sediment metagenome]|uniref:VOC domain-containing protein n=1 Tax=marine sediment metagenome TaxID=412755 RepID=A0A0F9MUB5_9ZZZZ
MKVSLHHAHIFASNLDESISFYQEMFGAEIILDLKVGGARNVMIVIGSSKINFYDQPPKDKDRGSVHHLGIETDDIVALVSHMKSKGFEFRKPVNNLEYLKYVMVAAPDNILLELFEFKKGKGSGGGQFEKLTSLR